MNEEEKRRDELQEKVQALKKKIEAVRAESEAYRGKPVNIFTGKPASPFLIITIIALGWGLHALDLHYKHHHPRCFLAAISLFFAIGCSVFFLYCWVKRKVYNGRAPFRGIWIHRDEDPFFYWLYMIQFLLMDAVFIYELIALSHK